MLATGLEAPDFEITTLRGAPVRLSSLRGTPVWIAFFRFATCPLCNYRVHSMVERWELFRGRDFRMLAFFQSPADRLKDWVAEEGPEFDLVADPEMTVYELYGLESSWVAGMKPAVAGAMLRAATAPGVRMVGPVDGPPHRVPGDYLVDRSGIIQLAYRGKDLSDHLPLEAADDFLRSQDA